MKGGRLNIDSAEFTAGTAIIVTNAVLGGTGTIKVPITVKEHGALAGSFTATQGVTFEDGAVIYGDAAATITGDVDLAGTVVEVDDVDAVTDGKVFLTVTGTATGKPSLSAALSAVTQHNGKNGKWGVKSTTANGVTTYSLVWMPTGLVVIIH